MISTSNIEKPTLKPALSGLNSTGRAVKEGRVITLLRNEQYRLPLQCSHLPDSTLNR